MLNKNKTFYQNSVASFNKKKKFLSYFDRRQHISSPTMHMETLSCDEIHAKMLFGSTFFSKQKTSKIINKNSLFIHYFKLIFNALLTVSNRSIALEK